MVLFIASSVSCPQDVLGFFGGEAANASLSFFTASSLSSWVSFFLPKKKKKKLY